jgi:diguanylate cyclase (GGDEF)-like protein
LDVTPVITHKIDKVNVVSTLSLPIKIANKVVGIISLGQFKKKAFSKEDIRLFTLVRDHLIVILENSLLYEKVEKLSITDGLTKLVVHRYFQEALIKEIKSAEKGNYPVSLFMIDIDYFKEYNDRYGHPTGDIVLQKVAQILLDNARSTDIVARYGGEEFGIILPHTDKNGAITLGKRITKAVEEYKFPKEDNRRGRKITVSIGLATYPDDVLTSSALIDEADKALYQAKKNGKNQICFYKDVQIEYQHNLPIKARKIALLGDFNNWSKEKYLLENIKGNLWRLKVKLFPGKYRYKFLINDTIWLSDPKASEYVDDEYGEKTSLLVVD